MIKSTKLRFEKHVKLLGKPRDSTRVPEALPGKRDIKDTHLLSFIIEPVNEISNNVVCVTSKVSDQPAHTRSLIRAFASRLSIL